MKARTTQVVGWGKYVPEGRLTNQELEERVDTSDEWVRSHTGIGERRIASPEETSATMAIRAGASALRVAGIGPRRVDLIIVATITPDYPFPSTACLVQAALGAGRAAAFDVGAACTGFVYALGVAHDMIRSGTYDNALVIATETLSRIVDPMDRDTCVLFGDGAGAVVLQAAQGNGGILSVSMGSDGSGAELLIQPAGGSRFPATRETVEEGLHYVRMDGKAIYRFATHRMPRAIREAVRKAGFRVEDVALVIPHQANGRIIEAAMKRLQLPPDRAYLNLERYGNMSAASIPVALCEAIEEGRLKQGDLVVLVGFGAGLTWGSVALSWTAPWPLEKVSWEQRIGRRLGFRWAYWRLLLRRLSYRILRRR